ncbi:hypothetical protein Tco_1128221 [Tanacetum coccineum]
MVPATAPLIGFSEEIIWQMGKILLLAMGEENSSSLINSSRNIKIPVPGGILTLRSSKIISLECTMVSGPEAQPSDVIRAAKVRIKMAIHPEYPEQTITIGFTLTEEGKKEL